MQPLMPPLMLLAGGSRRQCASRDWHCQSARPGQTSLVQSITVTSAVADWMNKMNKATRDGREEARGGGAGQPGAAQEGQRGSTWRVGRLGLPFYP